MGKALKGHVRVQRRGECAGPCREHGSNRRLLGSGRVLVGGAYLLRRLTAAYDRRPAWLQAFGAWALDKWCCHFKDWGMPREEGFWQAEGEETGGNLPGVKFEMHVQWISKWRCWAGRWIVEARAPRERLKLEIQRSGGLRSVGKTCCRPKVWEDSDRPTVCVLHTSVYPVRAFVSDE